MKRAAPYLLFAGVTLAVFWKFLVFGHTMHAVAAIETQLGRAPQEPRGWFKSPYRHVRITDNAVVLAGQLRIYNEGLKQNELRLWNPDLLCGLPLYADPMLHPFYPPHLLLHRIFSPDAAYELGLLLHLFFAGAAMYWLLRGVGRSEVAATVGGLVWMLGGYNAMWFSTGILAGATVFGPLALLAILKGIGTRDRSRAALAAAAMGMAILGSHPQHALLLFLALLAWIGYAARRSPESRGFVLRFGAIFALLSVGVGLAAILTRLDTIENGYRDPEFDRLSLYAAPGRLATYVASLVLGKVYFPGPAWESEFAVYAGLAAAALAVVGALRHWNETGVRVAAVVGLVAIATAFLYPLAWLFTSTPILNLSPPSRCLFLAGFAVAYLSAHGIDANLGRMPKILPIVALAVTVAAVLLAGFAGALETALGCMLAVAAARAALQSKPAAAGIAVAAILFELLPPFFQVNYHADSSLMSQVPEPVRVMKADPGGPWRGSGILGTAAVSTRSPEWDHDLVTGNNLLALYGVENVAGFEAVIPSHYVAFSNIVGTRFSPTGRTIQFTRFDSALFDFTGLRHVLLPAALPMPDRFRPIGTYGSVTLYENRAALPRARFIEQVLPARDAAEAERLMKEKLFDPRRQAVVEIEPPVETSEGEVTWKERTPDRLVLDVNAKKNGMLVVADTDYPGWEATIDGKPAEIFRANLAFRALEIPAGSHRVEFRFRPASARQGLIASSLFLLLTLAAAFLRRKP